jgi:hypothetical protein
VVEIRKTIMAFNLHVASLPALALLLALSAAPASFAEDAMAPAADAMAPSAMAPGTMTPMSDADFETCTQQAGMLTFDAVKMAAMAACDGLHKGMDVMGAIQSMQSQGAMAPDAMAPADAMAPVTK